MRIDPLITPLAIVVAMATVATVALSSTADAQFLDPYDPRRERATETPGPSRGYSGFIRYGNRSLYCDYVRYPNRVCSTDRAGRERCRVRGWRLVQSCK